MKDWFTARRFKAGWELYRTPALGTGLPLYCCLILFLLVLHSGLHPGLWILGLMVACQVEAWAFHSKKGTLSVVEQPAGSMWGIYGLFGVGMSCMFFEKDADFLPVVRVYAGIAAFLLTYAFALFIVGFMHPEPKTVPPEPE